MSMDRIVGAASGYWDELDQACAFACKGIWLEHNFSGFELREGDRELFKLSEREDLAYDRPSIGLHYALLYHLERTHMLVQALIPLLAGRPEPLTIYDIGSGTGATAWATAVVTRACREAGLVPPTVRLYGLDTSPFMIEAAHRLWNALPENLRKGIRAEHQLGSWHDPLDVEHYDRDALIVGSYLFNSSDYRHLEGIEAGLTHFSDYVSANRLLLISPSAKAHLADTFTQAGKWKEQLHSRTEPIWIEVPSATREIRRGLLRQVRITRDPARSYETLVNNREYQCVRLFKRANQQLQVPGTSVWHRLNKEQMIIARSHTGPTYLVGPAGSGKSVVLIERLISTLRSARSGSPWVLVTSFNKAMVEELVRLTRSRIDNSLNVQLVEQKPENSHRREADCTITVRNSSAVSATIRFLNFDKLPSKVWNCKPVSRRFLDRAIFYGGPDGIASGIGTRAWSRDFVRNELRLVVYGLEAMSYNEYMKVERKGRGTPLRPEHRMSVWPSMRTILLTEETTGMEMLRRRMAVWLRNEAALDAARPMVLQEPFEALTHVFVDEAQDMTRADIRMLALTPPSPRQLFLVGDSAQALHSHGIGPMPDIDGVRWRRPGLHGSYRLPALVCAPVANMAEAILADQQSRRAGGVGSPPVVSRSAVPGPRPVIVCGTDREGMRMAMETMACFVPRVDGSGATWYVVSGGGSITGYQKLMEGTGVRVQPLSILKEKGLERPLVFFPTDYRPPGDKSKREAVYAAVTRACAVLMIAVHPHRTSRATADALSALNHDRDQLMFWNERAISAWETMLGRSTITN